MSVSGTACGWKERRMQNGALPLIWTKNIFLFELNKKQNYFSLDISEDHLTKFRNSYYACKALLICKRGEERGTVALDVLTWDGHRKKWERREAITLNDKKWAAHIFFSMSSQCHNRRNVYLCPACVVLGLRLVCFMWPCPH